ncbi:MAG: tRNA (N(6)-L-threonylcarbamoyladenosine(37)-C(2))-methylthiotransferase MtaB [Leptospiraceae bacterium]|nr:tRNA (N(6)-L-threonylcarbamoyladenosine(37)-C(2))-methylthiotransferase MtaB [Leptospiraceae bacterium]MCP5513316.1 tRNA (N(6)-L-threonylcarbamoyladenosine(37)-C(2))-methylthiotransferase MtaB [Leptospiraceae bacterium]
MNEKFRVGFQTLGCRLNIFESDGLAQKLESMGLETVSLLEKPEVVVINTCTVTNKADSKNRNLIRNTIKTNPGAQVWVTGCYAETDKEILENIPGITGVVGNSEKSKLPYLILQKKSIEVEIPDKLDRFSYSDVLPVGHTRAYLKIQDGCNRVCSYCKIPSARGKGISRNEEDVLKQVEFLQDNGVGEIILTGVNLGWFRNSDGKKSFQSLLEKILKRMEYSRIRISSIEPSDVNEGLAELLTHPRFCNFLHVPLQSGSTEILKKMKRSYSSDSFRKRIEVVLKRNPNIFLGTDVITGFPGETEEMFHETLSILKEFSFSKIHAFPYSPRKGTKAMDFPDQIPGEIKKQRVKVLNQLSNENYANYCKKNIGNRFEFILERGNSLVSDNNIRGKMKDESLLQNLKIGQFLELSPVEYRESTGKEGYCYLN